MDEWRENHCEAMGKQGQENTTDGYEKEWDQKWKRRKSETNFERGNRYLRLNFNSPRSTMRHWKGVLHLLKSVQEQCFIFGQVRENL